MADHDFICRRAAIFHASGLFFRDCEQFRDVGELFPELLRAIGRLLGKDDLHLDVEIAGLTVFSWLDREALAAKA